MPDPTNPNPTTALIGRRSPTPGSASVGPGQEFAAEIWDRFKERDLAYIDMLELCAVLICNVADKSGSTDKEIAVMTFRLVHDMRGRSRGQNDQALPQMERPKL